MNELIEKEEIKIENMIYEVRNVQVMLDCEVSETKCHDYKYDILVTHYYIGKPISVFMKEGKILWN